MLEIIRDLFRHQAWADVALLEAIAASDAARQDEDLLRLLAHVLAVHRFFVATARGVPPEFRQEPVALHVLTAGFAETHASTAAWLETLVEADLERTLDIPYFQGRVIPVRAALLQVVLHTQGHRSQCLTRLRVLTGTAPTLDYIIWSNDRLAARA